MEHQQFYEYKLESTATELNEKIVMVQQEKQHQRMLNEDVTTTKLELEKMSSISQPGYQKWRIRYANLSRKLRRLFILLGGQDN